MPTTINCWPIFRHIRHHHPHHPIGHVRHVHHARRIIGWACAASVSGGVGITVAPLAGFMPAFALPPIEQPVEQPASTGYGAGLGYGGSSIGGLGFIPTELPAGFFLTPIGLNESGNTTVVVDTYTRLPNRTPNTVPEPLSFVSLLTALLLLIGMSKLRKL